VLDNVKVAVVAPSNLGPYHLARYNALAELCDLHVVPVSVKEHYRPWDFSTADARFHLHDALRSTRGTPGLRLSRELACTEPDATIVVGYGSLPLLLGAAARRVQNRYAPNLLLMDTTSHGRWPGLKRQLKPLFDGVLVSGSRAMAVARDLYPSLPATVVGNPVDNSHFAKSINQWHRSGFLCVARFSSEKNYPRLLEAWNRYRATGGTWGLKIVGTGPEEELVRAAARSQEGLSFIGWATYAELPDIYASSCATILASLHEPWGLVVNESLASGTPCILSRSCGCFPDLSFDTQWSFDPVSVQSISQALHRFSSLDGAEYASLQEAGARLVDQQTPARWAGAVVTAIDSAIASRRKS
jgi:1,2-diacylglycerol 3-alpha-glucosyltransferase